MSRNLEDFCERKKWTENRKLDRPIPIWGPAQQRVRIGSFVACKFVACMLRTGMLFALDKLSNLQSDQLLKVQAHKPTMFADRIVYVSFPIRPAPPLALTSRLRVSSQLAECSSLLMPVNGFRISPPRPHATPPPSVYRYLGLV